jgi:hypothetical protein
MTMNEEALIERLIVEAAKRGAVELERERAVRAGEEAAKVLESVRMEFLEAREFNTDLRAKVDEHRRALHESANREQSFVIVLSNLVNEINLSGKSRLNKDGRDALQDAVNLLKKHVPF